MFAGFPDFSAELVASTYDGDSEWGEWEWRGKHADGSPFAMRGVTILELREGLIARARLYLEPVEESAEDIETAVRELYGPSGSSTGP